MPEHEPLIEFGDEVLTALLERYGGWPRLLDPDQVPPEEFITELQALGYSLDEFNARRASWNISERDCYIELLAYLTLRMEHGKDDGSGLDHHISKVSQFQISDEEIRAAKENARRAHRTEFEEIP